MSQEKTVFTYYTVVPRGRHLVISRFEGSSREPDVVVTVDLSQGKALSQYRRPLNPETVERYLGIARAWVSAGAEVGRTVTISKDLKGADSFVVNKGMAEAVDPETLRRDLAPGSILASKSGQTFWKVDDVMKDSSDPDKTQVLAYRLTSVKGALHQTDAAANGSVGALVRKGISITSEDEALLALTSQEA